jgi:hypothetical protein
VELDDDTARVRSKGIGVSMDGTVSTVVYDDVAHRTAQGWRLARRKIRPRQRPLTP